MRWIQVGRSTRAAVQRIPLPFRSASRSCRQPQTKPQDFFGRIFSRLGCDVLMNWNLQQVTAEKFGARSGAMALGITAIPEFNAFDAPFRQGTRSRLLIPGQQRKEQRTHTVGQRLIDERNPSTKVIFQNAEIAAAGLLDA